MEIEHVFCDGVYIKKCLFARGEDDVQHKHSFAHVSAVASGFFRVYRTGADGATEIFELGPGDTLEIPAETVHAVYALTAGTWLCIHRTDCTDPAQIDHQLISKPKAPCDT